MEKLNLKIPRPASAVRRKPVPEQPGHEHHTHLDASGTGSEDYPFGTPDELVKRALRRAAKAERRAKQRQKKAGKNPKQGDTQAAPTEAKSDLLGGLVLPKPVLVVPPGETRDSFIAGQVLLRSADGMQELMMARMFDGYYEQALGGRAAIIAWGLVNMPAKKMPATQSLSRQFEKLTASYKTALPQLTSELVQKNPKAPLIAVMEKAKELLDQELARIFYVLDIYCESIKQVRDGRFTRELNAIEIFFEDAFRLYFTGDLHDVPAGTTPAVQLPNSAYRIGDVFMSRVSSSGLATVPGAKGPIGANALQFPFEMLDICALVFDLLGHEARHNAFHDITGLEDEMLDVIEAKIREAHRTGKLKLKNETMMLGGQKVKTIDLLVKLMRDWLGEIDADFVGGVLFAGPSFGDNMIMSFPAMMVRDGKVSQKIKLLRTTSRFDLIPQPDGTVGLVFEEHPVDYIRVYFVAAALEEIGFAAKAKELRQLADFAVGDQLPTEIVYTDAEGKSDMEIRFAVADLQALASVIAEAIIRTPMKAQLGKSCGDLIMWNAKRQAKVDRLTDILARGESDPPNDIGSVFATYVGAAASQAYIKLVREGNMTPAAAARLVNEAALQMIGKLRTLPANQGPAAKAAPVAPAKTK